MLVKRHTLTIMIAAQDGLERSILIALSSGVKLAKSMHEVSMVARMHELYAS